MRKIFTIIILSAFFLAGCAKKSEIKKPLTISSFQLKNLVTKAISGNKAVNDSLHQLIDLTLPLNSNYNQFSIDSISVNNKKFYSVLITFPNPIYNRFAIYDNSLRNYLLDKSLNGYVNEKIISLNSYKYFRVLENFVSKDNLNLQRLSLYSVKNSGANLIFRAFTQLNEPHAKFEQKIDEISPDRIKTSFSSSIKSSLRNKADIFEFDSAQNKYVSKAEVFLNFIKARIKYYKHRTIKKELTDRKSALNSVGINPEQVNIKDNKSKNTNYTISITNDWSEIKDLSINDGLKKRLKGDKYLNNLIGASISVIPLYENESAEMYINYDRKLRKKKDGSILVRYSSTKISGRSLIQYYEFSCDSKKYLLILSCSKYTFKKYQKLYSKIINSFHINC